MVCLNVKFKYINAVIYECECQPCPKYNTLKRFLNANLRKAVSETPMYRGIKFYNDLNNWFRVIITLSSLWNMKSRFIIIVIGFYYLRYLYYFILAIYCCPKICISCSPNFYFFSDLTPPVLYLLSPKKVTAVEFNETHIYKSSVLIKNANNFVRADLLYSADELFFTNSPNEHLWKYVYLWLFVK